MPHQLSQSNDVSPRWNVNVIANPNAGGGNHDDLVVQIVAGTMMTVFGKVLAGLGRRLVGLEVRMAILLSCTSTSCWQRDTLLPAHLVNHCIHHDCLVL